MYKFPAAPVSSDIPFGNFNCMFYTPRAEMAMSKNKKYKRKFNSHIRSWNFKVKNIEREKRTLP